jgi:hypothetical protein
VELGHRLALVVEVLLLLLATVVLGWLRRWSTLSLSDWENQSTTFARCAKRRNREKQRNSAW